MTAIRIDGRAIADALRADIAQDVALLAARGVRPGLAAVLVGDDPASAVYVRSKARQTSEAGMRSLVHRLDAGVPESELLALVRRLNGDPEVDGILVQLPLPPHIDARTVLKAIDPSKDVDGFHPVNAGMLATESGGIPPCTPLGVMMLIRSVCPDPAGRDAVVVGASNIVGKPMAQMLLAAGCTVSIAHILTRDLKALCRRADILVVAAGVPGLIAGDAIKPGAIVIDVGINRIVGQDGKTRIVGDVVYPEAVEVASAVSPVPGGVGPMTIACLLRNTLAAAAQRRGLDIGTAGVSTMPFDNRPSIGCGAAAPSQRPPDARPFTMGTAR